LVVGGRTTLEVKGLDAASGVAPSPFTHVGPPVAALVLRCTGTFHLGNAAGSRRVPVRLAGGAACRSQNSVYERMCNEKTRAD